MRPAMQLANSPGMVSSVISGKRLFNALVQFARDRRRAPPPAARRSCCVFRQLVRVFRKVHAQHGEVVFLAGHGIAEDHRRALRVQRALGISVILQGFARAGDRPLLRFVHGIGDARRNRQMPLHRVPHVLAHPAADLGIGLVGRRWIGIVIERRIPAVGRDLGDAVRGRSSRFPRRWRRSGHRAERLPRPQSRWLDERCFP